MSRPLLSHTQLGTLHSLWRSHDAPIADRLRPGLSDAEMDGLVGEIGLRLPTEARTWWGWHDGATSDKAVGAELGPDLRVMSLSEALHQYRFWRGLFEEEWPSTSGEFLDDPDYWWRPTWLPILERRGAIRCETDVPPGEPCPIYWAYSHDHDAEGLTQPRVASLGEMVAWWIDALQDGSWEFDNESRRWVAHPELMAPERERSGLI